ncbi:MAG TPA: ankyrin repeat domain-containing protein, partial [Elusimicrobiota bacterium]|nr:ankyrin repeat domain-containing protein [Elusimicrobiota bacterium]
MKTTILLCACALLGAIGCAVGGGDMKSDGDSGGFSGSSPMLVHRGAHHAAESAPEDLLGAAARGDLEGVRSALRSGVAVDERNSDRATPLLLAASGGYLPVVQTLLGAGADANAADQSGRTPLAAATAGGYDDVARALTVAGARGAPAASSAPAAAGAQWWQNGAAAAPRAPEDLLGAAARGDLAGVQAALRSGVAVDERNSDGATPLLLAASGGYLPVVQTLLGA